MSYIFITPSNNENETIYYAISPERIETLPLWSTYSKYGQIVGHYDAGDYHMDNEASVAVLDCKKAIAEKFDIDLNDIHIIDNGGAFEIEAGDGEEYGFDEDAVNNFIAKWREENENLIAVEGFTYWDGQNWQTILVQAEIFDTNYEIVDDENLVADLNKAIEEKEFVREGFGTKIYEGNGWTVEDNYCQGEWASYRVYEKKKNEED